jgi:hypothetical protein
MGNQTQTMTVIITQATRLPLTNHVQITMSPTTMIVREARPAVWVMYRVMSVPVYLAHWILEGSNQRRPSVSKRLEARKMLGRILKARPLVVGTHFAGRVDKHITFIVEKEQLDRADF